MMKHPPLASSERQPTKRVVLYARYSTDQQNPASIQTQLDLGRAMIEAKGWQLIDSFIDAGISGANYETRSGLQAALFVAQQRTCDVFLCLTLDRLSRDLEHSAKILKLLQFHDVELWTVQGGIAVSAIELGIRAVLSQETIEQTRYRTREGMKSVAKGGRVPGGLCFGYRIVREYDAAGNLIRGLRAIAENEAEIIITIFKDFSNGLTPDAIASKLNRLEVPGPRGKPWQATAIRGHRNRGTGILNNEMYIGRLVFNRQEYRKNPATERRVSRVNPIEEHIVVNVPELRIVSDSLWQRAKRKQGPYVRRQQRVSEM